MRKLLGRHLLASSYRRENPVAKFTGQVGGEAAKVTQFSGVLRFLPGQVDERLILYNSYWRLVLPLGLLVPPNHQLPQNAQLAPIESSHAAHPLVELFGWQWLNPRALFHQGALF